MSKIRVKWSEKESVIEVSNTEELEYVLDDIAVNAGSEHPVIVSVDTQGYRVSLGLGRKESFVHFEQESGDPPYIITVGDSKAEGWGVKSVSNYLIKYTLFIYVLSVFSIILP